ncbi:kinase-like domain-containing protein [Chaetomium strumarium]|uniref:EKC/KEOPS complex subunit BUD32 n=1 Tax=Chaetomium strumarium TaxID=1170767 RepID=A0AAJ0M3R4_9PEZI|nr:kinase-like domain-containing protein [Chaetomium strumarium]
MSEFAADDEIRYPSGFGLSDVVGWGTTGMVVLDKPSNTVLKVPFYHNNEECLLRMRREQEVCERFAQRGGHEGLLSYHGVFESGIRLEYASRHNLRLHLGASDVSCRAIRFVHDAGVIHEDLTCANIFLDACLNAKVADFAGSSIDGSPLLVVVTESHEFPGPRLSVQADLFAPGSMLYEIMTGHPPYEELDDTEIRALYLNRKFPETASLGAIGTVIEQCWQGNYSGAEAVVEKLRDHGVGCSALFDAPFGNHQQPQMQSQYGNKPCGHMHRHRHGYRHGRSSKGGRRATFG